jgi:glycosyltransferase involved in cell wall biosynthesis
MKRRRITVVTAGHLSTCPRMVKAAAALHESGYDVHVISARHTPWAVQSDRDLHARRAWRWEVVDCSREASSLRWFISGARAKAASAVTARANGRVPLRLAAASFSRAHADLVAAIMRTPSDLILNGGGGAIAAAVEASRRMGTPCGVDFEDFHCAEHDGETGNGRSRDAVAARIIADAIQHASFVTAGSDAIADACEQRFGRRPVPIHNVFRLPAPPASTRAAGPLRLYWFSQTIGAGRGLEDLVRAAGRARVSCELHLRGVAANGYLEGLHALASAEARALRIVIHAPADPDSMIDACRPFDAGIAAEPGHGRNNALALSNKALTYPLAGLALVMTDTPGQRPLAGDLGGDALLYAPGDIERLSEGLARWAADPAALQRAREAAWHAAQRRWHWDHDCERGALLRCIRTVLA